jgi:hypothetical protein
MRAYSPLSSDCGGNKLKECLPKINDPIKNWATELNRTFPKKEVQKAKTQEKMLTISGHKGNATQNHTKIPPHSCSICYHQKHHQQQEMLARVWGKMNPLLVGM